MRNRKSLKKSLGAVALMASFGLLMYLKNRLIPKYADDYPYSFVWDGKNNGNLAFGDHRYKRVKTPEDLLQSQLSHYMTWDGRAIAESLVQLFLISDDKKHFDRANTAVMLFQLMLCASLGKGKRASLKDLTPLEAFLLTAGFFLCAPHLIATCFWLTGSMNYLWMGILQSAFVLPYSLDYHGMTKKPPGMLVFLLGLLSGWSTETGAGAAAMFAGMETFYAIAKKRYRSWMGWGLFGTAVGLALLLLAPGNKKKLYIENEMSDTLPDTMEEALPGYIPTEYLYTPAMFKKWFKEGFMVTILRELPLQVPVLLYFLKNGHRDKKSDMYLMALEAVALAVPSVMMFSPEYPRRATYPSVIYLLAADVFALERLGITGISNLSPAMKKAGLAAAVGYVLTLFSSFMVDADLSFQIDRQVDHILKNKDRELIFVEDVYIPPLYEKIATDRSINWDVLMGVCLDNPDDPYNTAAAAYYGTGKIYTQYDEDHIYEKKDLHSLIYGLIKPLRSFAFKVKEICF